MPKESVKEYLDSLKPTDVIEIVDHDRPMPYGKVKDSVIYLGGQFFFKVDNRNLIKLKDGTGKKRLFRKTSKLIKEISPGVFVHRSQAIETESGVWLDKNDPDTVVVNGQPTRKEYAIQIGNKYYLKSDAAIRKCLLSGEFILEKDAVQLHPTYYKKEKWINKNYIPTSTQEYDGGIILTSDARLHLDDDGNEVYIHKNVSDVKTKIQVFHKFRDVTNPQFDRIDMILMFADQIGNTVEFPELGQRVHRAHIKGLKKIYEEVILVREAKETAQLKAALKYSDDGPDENQAKAVKKITTPWPGKYNVHTPPDMTPTLSKTTVLTGGLKYTFGVEYETSQGLLSNDKSDKLKLKIVGDRSIGAGEYVTGVLHGDAGIELVKQQCLALAKSTLVDDKCGIHVHIGGMENTSRVEEADFDRHFAIAAIKLGCQLEEELYRSCPESRKPTLKHCHSILRWRDINDSNWREYLGAYVFGPEENWKNPWTFAPYKYGSAGMSKRDGVDTWCGGRYKWLNLVHILTRSKYCTCELRLFPGSTNFDKIYNYIMTSMAFVWFIENRLNLIEKGGVTLSTLFTETFGNKYPELARRLITFYKQRTKKFDRGTIYPAKIPAAIL